MTLPQPRAVIFDWDDTIVSSWHIALESLNTALVHMGQEPWTDEEARKRAGPSAKDMFQSLFGARWEEADKIYYDTFNRLIVGNLRIHDDAENLLKTLSEKGIYLAVVSNKRGELLRKEASHAGLSHYFKKIVGAGDATADKPDPAPVTLALEGSGIEAGRDVWFIGDSYMDMRCAFNAKCTPVLIETKPPPEETLVNNPPAKRFSSHKKIMEFIGANFS